MYRLCLVACLASCCDGLRLETTRDRIFNNQDVKGEKFVKQINAVAASESGGRTNRSGSMFNPRKVIPILLAFFNPTAGFASGRQTLPISKKLPGSHARPRVAMMERNHADEFVNGPTVRAVVSVDWEGRDLRSENLRVFEDLRKAHPDVPLTHFLNAAYFTKSGYPLNPFTGAESRYEWNPLQALRPINESGLHFHGWKSLVESSGVDYRSEPNFNRAPMTFKFKDLLILEMKAIRFLTTLLVEGFDTRRKLNPKKVADEGWDVDIRAYSVDELQAIIANSKVILEENGLKVGNSFRAGAWLAGPNVLEAIRREGFVVDSSAVDADKWLGARAGPLSAMLRELWRGVTNESQPFLIDTPAGRILEMPDTGALADYTTAEQMVDHIDSAVQQLESEDRFVHIGFHQESAADWGPRVIEAITEIKGKHGHRVVFETLEASAQRSRLLAYVIPEVTQTP